MVEVVRECSLSTLSEVKAGDIMIGYVYSVVVKRELSAM